MQNKILKNLKLIMEKAENFEYQDRARLEEKLSIIYGIAQKTISEIQVDFRIKEAMAKWH